MRKIDVIYLTEEGTKLADLSDINPQEDEYYQIISCYTDLKEVESIMYNKPFNGQNALKLVMKSGDIISILGNMEQLAEEVEKVKTYHILGIN